MPISTNITRVPSLLLLLLLHRVKAQQSLIGGLASVALDQPAPCDPEPSWISAEKLLSGIYERSELLLQPDAAGQPDLLERAAVTLYHSSIDVITELLRILHRSIHGHDAVTSRLRSLEKIIRLQHEQIVRARRLRTVRVCAKQRSVLISFSDDLALAEAHALAAKPDEAPRCSRNQSTDRTRSCGALWPGYEPGTAGRTRTHFGRVRAGRPFLFAIPRGGDRQQQVPSALQPYERDGGTRCVFPAHMQLVCCRGQLQQSAKDELHRARLHRRQADVPYLPPATGG